MRAPMTRSPLRPLVVALLAACTLLVAVAPASAQSRSERIRERLKTRPEDPTLWYFLAGAEFAEGHRDAGLDALAKVDSLGNGFLPVHDLGFESVWEDSAFQRRRAHLESRLPRVSATARPVFRLEKGLIPEGIAWDPKTRCYFVGSIAERKIVRVDAAGKVTDFSRPGELGNVLGLVVDAPRRRLHAVSTSLVGTPDSTTNRVVTYDLVTGALVRSVTVAAAAQLNDVTLGPGGDLFTTDSRAGGVFRIHDATGAIDTLVVLPGANGIAVSADGAALYVAHSTGVARFDLASGDVLARIAIPAGETIAAIDGLYTDGDALIGVQNLTTPGRVVRIHLTADGKGADRIETLLSHHHPLLDEPTTGVLVGRTFALLATTQVARFTPEGKIEGPETLKAPVVLAIPLDRKAVPAARR